MYISRYRDWFRVHSDAEEFENDIWYCVARFMSGLNNQNRKSQSPFQSYVKDHRRKSRKQKTVLFVIMIVKEVVFFFNTKHRSKLTWNVIL